MKNLMIILFVVSTLFLSCSETKEPIIGQWEQIGGDEDINGKVYYNFIEGGELVRHWSKPNIDTEKGSWYYNPTKEFRVFFTESVPCAYSIENDILSLKIDNGEEQLFKKINTNKNN